MAHTKATGATQLGRDSISKRRGVKIFDGQPAKAGNIIVRQTGSKMVAGQGVRTGADYTLYAAKNGIVKFQRSKRTSFNGTRRVVSTVSVKTE